jgi:RNA polymerase sigma factor (sigma-70 family)
MSAKIGRNEPCPCSSGKKYNNCCGKNASGTVLNQLYDRYQLNPNDQQSVDDLFREIHDYASRILSKVCASNGWRSPAADTDDVVQTATSKIWEARATFGSRSKFSTWCYRIVRNAAIDAIRNMPRGEVELLSWKAYAAEYFGTSHGGCIGAAPDSGNANDAFAQRLLKSACKQNDDSDGHGFGVRPLLTKRFLSQQEDRLNADIDLRAKLNGLNPDDREITELFFVSRCTVLEIAKLFGKDTNRIGRHCSAGERWVQNRIAAIRMAFKSGELAHGHDGGESSVSRIELEHELELTVRLALIVPSRNPDGEADPFASRVLDASSNSDPEDQQNRKRAA